MSDILFAQGGVEGNGKGQPESSPPDSASGEPPRKRSSSRQNMSMLNHGQVAKLAVALAGMKENIHRRKPSLEDLAGELTAQLGFRVSKSNIDTQIRIGVIPEWRDRVIGSQTSSDGLTDRVDACEQKIRAMELRLAQINHDLDRHCNFGRRLEDAFGRITELRERLNGLLTR